LCATQGIHKLDSAQNDVLLDQIQQQPTEVLKSHPVILNLAGAKQNLVSPTDGE
jgi:hypothetical protein